MVWNGNVSRCFSQWSLYIFIWLFETLPLCWQLCSNSPFRTFLQNFPVFYGGQFWCDHYARWFIAGCKRVGTMFFYRLLKFAHMLLANHPMCIKCQSGGHSKPTKLIYQPKNAFLHKPKGHQRVARPDETRCIELDLWEICFRIFF